MNIALEHLTKDNKNPVAKIMYNLSVANFFPISIQ